MTEFLKLGPDGTPPEGAVPGSPRFERVRETELRGEYRLPLGMAGVVMAGAGALVVRGHDPWGILGCIAGGGALLAALTGGGRRDRYRRAENGAYVKATPEHEAQLAYERLAGEGKSPPWYRAVTGLAGALMVVFLVIGFFDSPMGTDELKAVLLVGLVALLLIYIAITGRSPWRNPDPPLPPGFRDYADPTRPLPPEVFSRGLPPATGGPSRDDV